MNLTTLIADYGYWAVFIGCFLEGETVLLLAGFAAHRGMLQFEQVAAVAHGAPGPRRELAARRGDVAAARLALARAAAPEAMQSPRERARLALLYLTDGAR